MWSVIKCWRPSDSTNIIEVQVRYNRDGTVESSVAVTEQKSDLQWRRQRDAAISAVIECQPISAPLAKYDDWKEVLFTFDPKEAKTNASKQQEQDRKSKMPPVGANVPKGRVVDILGVYPGMTFGKAKPLIEQATDGLSYTGSFKTEDLVTGQKYSYFFGGGDTRDARVYPKDSIAAVFSSPSTGHQVISVGRDINFAEFEQPNARQLVAALVDKYGPYDKNNAGDDGVGKDGFLTVPNKCTSFLWYHNLERKELYDGVMDFKVMSHLLTHVQGGDKAAQMLSAFNEHLQGRRSAGVKIVATVCSGDVVSKVSIMSITITDATRGAAALRIEKELVDDEARAVQRSRETSPVGAIPRL